MRSVFYNKKENIKVIDIVLVHPIDFEAASRRKKIITIQSTISRFTPSPWMI